MNICFAHSLSCKLFPISPRHFCRRRVLCLSFQLSLLGLSVQRLRWWWAQVDSNHRPRAYQARALTTWAMSPFSFPSVSSSLVPEVFNLFGGDDGIRTHDPLLAGQVLSQLSYTPILSYGSYFSILFVFSSKTATVSENRTTIDVRFSFRFSSDNTSRRLFSFSFDFCLLCFKQVTFSIERRWSSRTFRYGYLVTT